MLRDFAAIDFETANGSRTSICSVGIVIVRDGKITDSFYRLVRPTPNYYNYNNIRVHGIRPDDTENAKHFPEVWEEIASQLQGLPLVAHNKSFDESCLKAAFNHYEIPYPNYTFYCTLQASRKAFPYLESHRLNIVAAECDYHLEHHHHALSDAEACAQIALLIL